MASLNGTVRQRKTDSRCGQITYHFICSQNRAVHNPAHDNIDYNQNRNPHQYETRQNIDIAAGFKYNRLEPFQKLNTILCLIPTNLPLLCRHFKKPLPTTCRTAQPAQLLYQEPLSHQGPVCSSVPQNCSGSASRPLPSVPLPYRRG